MRRSRCVRIVGLTFLCLLPLTAGCSHGKESFYANFAAADKAGMVTRGWIPEFLPRSSRNIHEIGDISPTFEYCAFDFSPGDSRDLKKALTPVNSPPAWVRKVPDPRVSWWRSVLTGNLDVQRIRTAGFDVYTRSEPETVSGTGIISYFFAVDWAHGRAFFYCTLT